MVLCTDIFRLRKMYIHRTNHHIRRKKGQMEALKKSMIEAKLKELIEQSMKEEIKEERKRKEKIAHPVVGNVIRRRKGEADKRILLSKP